MPARRWVEVNNSSSNNNNNPSVISRIMLRFRPIAPKPAGGEATAADQEKINLVGRRTKRKYVRVRGMSRKSKQCVVRMKKMEKTSPTENSEVEDAPAPVKEVVTLQLLPERSEKADQEKESFGELRSEGYSSAEAGVIRTWIVVESVTEKYSEEGEVGLGCRDMERINDLERDTCPGFVTEGTNKVIWVNEAYKRMVGGERGLAAVLVVQGEMPQGGSFACRVRIVEQEQGQKWKNRIVPCDVWRMGSAGFAWKLDVNTALTLSLTL